MPHTDTYRRLFERTAPEALERCFLGWMKQIVEGSGAQVIPIGGKTIKGSYDRNSKQSTLHVVSAWGSEHRLLLGQLKVASMSNEITEIPALLKLLDISGCIITLDAIGTQKEDVCIWEIKQRVYVEVNDASAYLNVNNYTIITLDLEELNQARLSYLISSLLFWIEKL